MRTKRILNIAEAHLTSGIRWALDSAPVPCAPGTIEERSCTVCTVCCGRVLGVETVEAFPGGRSKDESQECSMIFWDFLEIVEISLRYHWDILMIMNDMNDILRSSQCSVTQKDVAGGIQICFWDASVDISPSSAWEPLTTLFSRLRQQPIRLSRHII